jgi:hypothetical protein
MAANKPSLDSLEADYDAVKAWPYSITMAASIFTVVPCSFSNS